MNWEDECYLLSKRKFRENANIINVLTQSRGKVSGIVYGGNSRKIRNYLQISNKLFVINNSKNENKIGYFKTELIKPISPNYFDDKKRTTALVSLCSLLNILLPESQSYEKIYQSYEKLLKSFNLKTWIFLYIFFELNLIKELGYDTNLAKYYDPKNDILKNSRLKIDEYTYNVPNFLILNKIPNQFSNLILKTALIFTKSIFLNKFFIPNNLQFPKSRVILESYFN